MSSGETYPGNNGKPWSYEEHVIAFNLYCRLPFGKLHRNNPDIIRLAALLRRTPGSLAMKLGNFASLDPSLQSRGIRGLSASSKGVSEVWSAFADDPEAFAFESERLMADLLQEPLSESAGIGSTEPYPEGADRATVVRTRVNQAFFRRRVLSVFQYQCCVTGIRVPELLVASHIIPWAAGKKHRLDPRNGLCLNALHDRAFDRGLMWIDEGFRVRFSARIRSADARLGGQGQWVTENEGQPLQMPGGFTPNPEFLKWHREHIAAC